VRGGGPARRINRRREPFRGRDPTACADYLEETRTGDAHLASPVRGSSGAAVRVSRYSLPGGRGRGSAVGGSMPFNRM
jgi:hypothetical protein